MGMLASARLLDSLIAGASRLQLPAVIAAATILAAVALVACALPALRAAKTDPMVALRYE